ncbi:TPA: AIPR family protein [Escherichia coli]|nr:AIPR family protein [Escherichia coli]HCO6449921.1 AIPR family protein [Escherichia coli]HCO6961964.1 AIPR family protein [Escherichia coli]
MTYTQLSDSSFWSALQQRKDLEKYGNLNCALYAIELHNNIDSIELIAPDIITEGGDDENIDILMTDRESKQIYLIQSYQSTIFRPQGAKPSKAQETAYAETALLSADIENIPLRIRDQVKDARDALRNNEIEKINVWFVHNCPETPEYEKPLHSIGRSIMDKLNSIYHIDNLRISSKQMGLSSLDELYNSQHSPILISDKISLTGMHGFYQNSNENWASFSTLMPGKFIKELYNSYGEDKLFSANVRSYLGSNKKDLSINNEIQNTAKTHPGNFFVFNNGITALVHDFEIDFIDESKTLGQIKSVTGISIVNGAQTTGSISNLGKDPDDTLRVAIRFIRVNNPELINEITLANNSQNKVLRSDFRSSDSIQKRLRKDFEKNKEALYTGGLRQVLTPAQKRILLPTDTVAQILIAFHAHPTSAYHRKKDIWDDEDLYKKAFDDTITLGHIIFVYSLNEAISQIKSDFNEQFRHNQLPEIDTIKHKLLTQPGVSLLMIHAIASILEIILGSAIPNKYSLSFKDGVNRENAKELWIPVIKRVLTRSALLEPATAGRLSKSKEITEIISRFQSDMDMYRDDFKELLPQFIANVHY